MIKASAVLLMSVIGWLDMHYTVDYLLIKSTNIYITCNLIIILHWGFIFRLIFCVDEITDIPFVKYGEEMYSKFSFKC